jgi:hypothetical protein
MIGAQAHPQLQWTACFYNAVCIPSLCVDTLLCFCICVSFSWLSSSCLTRSLSWQSYIRYRGRTPLRGKANAGRLRGTCRFMCLPCAVIGVIVNEAWKLEWTKVVALLAARTPRSHVIPRQGRTASDVIALSYWLPWGNCLLTLNYVLGLLDS